MAKKEIKSKPLPGAGSEPAVSAMVGGVSNKPGNPSEKKSGARMSFKHGGAVSNVQMGGFRNRAMEHKR